MPRRRPTFSYEKFTCVGPPEGDLTELAGPKIVWQMFARFTNKMKGGGCLSVYPGRRWIGFIAGSKVNNCNAKIKLGGYDRCLNSSEKTFWLSGAS